MTNLITFPGVNTSVASPIETVTATVVEPVRTPNPVTGVLFENRNVPWQNVGTNVFGSRSVASALAMSGLDWTVEQHQIRDAETGIIVPHMMHNVRSSDNASLGIVTDKYRVCQNAEAFGFIDSLLGEGNLNIEVAGEVKNGRKVWLELNMPQMTVLGEPVDPYLLFINTHDGSGAVKIAITPVRTWCKNTLNLALKKASRSWSCVHKSSLDSRLIEARDTLLNSQTYLEEFSKEAEKLALIRMDNKMIEDATKILFPYNEDKDNQRKINNAIDNRNEFLYRYKNADDLNNIRGTAYGFINAVSDFATHSQPKRLTQNYWENNFIRTIDGNALIDKAYDIALAM